jgi:hypothetical protein
MGEWLVLLYFSVQMLHVVMVLLVWFVGLFLYDFDCVFGVWGCGVVDCVVGCVVDCVWCVVGCVWCVGDCGLKVPSKN